MFSKLICMIAGHKFTAKTICDRGFVKSVLATCDRCGEGEEDLAQCKAIASTLGM